MSHIRWGILGASKFARQHMGPAIHAATGAELVAVASSSSEKVAKFQGFAPKLRHHSSYDALLEDPLIDAVYVPLPNDLHVPWALKALNAGKAVLVEKPVAMTLAELNQLIAARDASGLMAAEAFMIVHHPQWLKMRDLIAQGALGDLGRVDGVFTYDNSADPGNIRNAAQHGGGGLRDVGIYPFGAVRFATGQEPLDITHAKVSTENGVDVRAHVSAAFDGFTFGATASMRMMRWQSMEFHGSDGVARMSAPFNPGVFGEARIEIFRPDHSSEVYRWPELNQYVLQVEAFGRAMRGGDYICPLEFSRGSQAMIEAVLERAQK